MARTLDDDREPWQRQTKESLDAYEQFCTYLQIGYGRTVKHASELLGKNQKTTELLGVRQSWTTRATAWDERILAKAQDRAAEIVGTEVAKRHLNMAKLLQAVGAKGLQERARRYEKDSDAASRLPVQSAVKALTEGVKLERLLIGEPSERTDHKHEIVPIDARKDQAIAKLAAMIAQRAEQEDDQGEEQADD